VSVSASVPSEPEPELSVVIPCRNGAATLGVQLDALARQSWSRPWEVLLVDNGSTDDSVALAECFRDRLPALRVVDASGRPGQAYALNEGIRSARAEAVALCDADDEVGEGWLAALAEALGEHELVACRQDATKLNEPWVAAARDAVFTTGAPRVWFPPYAPHAGSGAMGLRRSVHEALDGFDEAMPCLFDTDFCIRAHLAGHELAFAPDAVVHYRHRDSLRGLFGQARRYSQQAARLQRRYREPGTRVAGQRTWLVEGWKPVLAALPRAGTRSGRARLAWLLGWQAGRYAGSVRYRVLAV
jgi:glycosyltransferase involved in cell wall biosynthesis